MPKRVSRRVAIWMTILVGLFVGLALWLKRILSNAPRPKQTTRFAPPVKAKKQGGSLVSKTREVTRLLTGQPTMEGAGVHLKRIFGFSETPLFDPFLLLDHFGSDNPAEYLAGFPWHPHRGIETITYVLNGNVAHGDSLGNKGTIGAGDVQWMTAGRGIIHRRCSKGTRQSAWRDSSSGPTCPRHTR